ncbi:SpaA isopeptide-forming pilin-related protein [Olsenella sp. YH-ols2221]|uniref:SpaA isopeptide-forming pilin-related protein n=1 Tax=Olsenella kribbiana TaxID=3115221 RepID=UPI002ED82A8F
MKKHSIARAAVTAGLTIAMSLGGALGPATMAFAAEGDNTITISNVQGNETSFKGYEIFKATVTDNTDGTKSVSNISWANDDVKAAVEGVISAQDTSYAGTTAQDAADWITANVTSTTNIDASNPVAEAIAKAVMGKTSQTTVEGGKASSALNNGYWLFVTDGTTVDPGSSTKASESYTLPIFAVVGGSAYTVTEKASIPTVEKKIVSDADNTEHDAADSHIGQDVRYNLYGTVAQDFATYDSYSYKFTDTVSQGLTIDSNSVKVYMYANSGVAKADVLHSSDSKVDVTNYFTSGVTDGTNGAHVLTVNVNSKTAPKGLKSITGATKDSVFVVSYTAKINSSAVIGNAGNPNTVYLEYSNNPNGEGTGRTIDRHVTDFTYGLNLVKVDQGTEQALAGAVFTIQVSSADDTATTNKYVAADGTLSDTAVNLTTDANGKIDVTGLDAGTYKVHEVSAPDGYSTVSDFTFTITPTINQNDQTVTLASTLNTTDSAHVIAGLSDGTTGDNTLTAQTGSGVTDNKTVNITVGDTKSVGLPLTGQAGVTLTWVAGGLVLAFGVSRVVRNRKQDNE